MFFGEFPIWSTKSITVRFLCPSCGHEIEECIENIPAPNLMAEGDSHSATQNFESSDAECMNCHKSFIFCLSAGIGGGDITCNELDENVDMEIENIDDAYNEELLNAFINNTSFFDVFAMQMEDNKSLFETINLIDPENSILNNLLFSNIITCMETYLSDVLITNVLTNQVFLQRYVENNSDYKNTKFSLNEIFSTMSNLQDTVKKDLLNLLYHNVLKIAALYKITFGISFPTNIGEIMKKVTIRHDLVHRNGKDKDGNLIVITSDELKETYELVYNYIKKIDEDLNGILP